MSRKRTPLHQSINSLAASLPDIPSVQGLDPSFGKDSAVLSTVAVSPEGDLTLLKQETLVGGHCDHETVIPVSAPTKTDFTQWVPPEIRMVKGPYINVLEPSKPRVPPPSAADLFTTWSRTPEGHRVTDSRIPTDPVRLGCILDDNARIAFMAGYAAATPSFE